MEIQVASQTLGFAHFISQVDGLSKTLLAILLVMSIASWYLVITKALAHLFVKRRSTKFIDTFWNASSLEAVAHEINAYGTNDPFSHLTSHAMFAREHHAKFGASKLEEAGSAAEFLTRAIRKVLDEETARMERGLTVLASVGATAPFVGLFGTVWGVYHALVAIGMSGAGTLDKVAGSVGEALIMTGLGLAVAIPAVLGYNALVRSNRVTLAHLDAFAYDLFAFLVTGQQINADGNVRPLKPAAPIIAKPAAA